MNRPSNTLPDWEPLIYALAAAGDLPTVRQLLATNPTLLQADIDHYLTEKLQAAWSCSQFNTVRDLVACRTFLARCRAHGVTTTLAQPVDLPLALKSPLGQLYQLSYSLSDLPARAPHARRALDEVRRSTEPDLWATLHRDLADSMAQSMDPQRAEDLEAALASFHHALSVWNEPPYVGLSMWAQTLHALATTLCRRVKGQRIANLRAAIQLYVKALTVRTKQAYPNEWAETQHELGKAWFALPSTDRTATIRKAIHHYSNALIVGTRPPYQWAQVAHDLAIAWSENPSGDPNENFDKAIKLRETVQEILTAQKHPLEWARSQNALGNAYVLYLHGDRTANLEKALDACTTALSVLSHPTPDWARAHYTLAVAYRHRPIGNKTDNFTKAIHHAESALSVFTPATYPFDWAHVQTSLGNVYSQSETVGARATNLEKALNYYKNALEVRTADQDPIGWATIQNNLGNTYADRIAGDRAANQAMALTCYANALKQRTRPTSPARWAETMNNLGTLYIERLSGDPSENQQQAVHYLRQALEVHTPDLFPNDARRAARNLAHLLLTQGQWTDAAHYYAQALTASDNLYYASATPIARQAELREASDLATRLAYALTRQANVGSNLETALVHLERNRARWLTESLALRSTQPPGVPDNVWNSFITVAAQVRQLQTAAQLPDDAPDHHDFLTLSAQLATARAALNRAIDQVRTYDPIFMPTPSFADIQAAFTVNNTTQAAPGVYLLTTPQGGLALIAHAAHVTVVRLDKLTEETLTTMLRAWFTAYNASRRQPTPVASQLWFDQIDAITRRLWDIAIDPVVAALDQLGLPSHGTIQPPVITIIPTGLLALLPLHAAWKPLPTPPQAGEGTVTGSSPSPRVGEGRGKGARRYFLDDYAVRYAPSATALRHCQERAVAAQVNHLLAIDEPKPITRGGPLPNSGREVAAIASLFATPTLLAHTAATHTAGRTALVAAQVAHFSCHGTNNWRNPLGSGLLLANDKLLSVRDFLELHLPGARLATLSACETGIVGADLPDEVIMLPSALVQAGYAGVVASLWSVADVSTAMLMVRFYQYWREEGLEPVYALRAAQRWLRDTTNQEKANYFGQFVPELNTRMADGVAAEFFSAAMLSQEGLDARSFEQPFWWGAFYLTGV